MIKLGLEVKYNFEISIPNKKSECFYVLTTDTGLSFYGSPVYVHLYTLAKVLSVQHFTTEAILNNYQKYHIYPNHKER